MIEQETTTLPYTGMPAEPEETYKAPMQRLKGLENRVSLLEMVPRKDYPIAGTTTGLALEAARNRVLDLVSENLGLRRERDSLRAESDRLRHDLADVQEKNTTISNLYQKAVSDREEAKARASSLANISDNLLDHVQRYAGELVDTKKALEAAQAATLAAQDAAADAESATLAAKKALALEEQFGNSARSLITRLRAAPTGNLVQQPVSSVNQNLLAENTALRERITELAVENSELREKKRPSWFGASITAVAGERDYFKGVHEEAVKDLVHAIKLRKEYAAKLNQSADANRRKREELKRLQEQRDELKESLEGATALLKDFRTRHVSRVDGGLVWLRDTNTHIHP